MDAMNTSAMNPAAIGMGAVVTARASRPSPWSRDAKCNPIAQRAAMANRTKKTVLMLMPWNLGMTLLNGTP